MATIPLPALDVKPPIAQSSPLETYGQLMQLKNQQVMQPLQQQAAQQQVQSGQLDIEKKQMEEQSSQALMKSFAGVSPTDPNYFQKGLQAAQSSGQVLPQHLQGVMNAAQEFKSKGAALNKTQLETMQNVGDSLHALGSQYLQMPDEQMVQAWPAIRQKVLSIEGMDPTKAAQSVPEQFPGREWVQSNVAVSGMSAAGARAAAAQQQTGINAEKQANEAPGQIATSTQKQLAIAAQQLSTAANQNDYLAKRGQLPYAVATQFPDKFDRNKILTVGQTPEQQMQSDPAIQANLAAVKAGAEARARMPYEMAVARQKQVLSQGDPRSAAQLLLDGDATLSELKARGSTPEFISQTLQAAHQMSGGKYNAQSAEAQFSVAKSPQQVQFFGSAKSLTDPGGTLDQLAETAKRIPQNQIPKFNSIEDWTREAAGSGPLAEYASRVLGVADDYSKVMGGGIGSDQSRLQAANLVSAKLSKEGREGALNGIRGSVNSQINSRIGSNLILRRMYGSGAPVQGGGSQAQPQQGGNDPFAQFGGRAH